MTTDRDRGSIEYDLASRDDEVRRLAVERLLTLPAAEAIPLLVDALGDASWRVRKAAVERLTACAEVDAVIRQLIESLADGENSGRRNAALEALIACGPRALDGVCAALETRDADVRKQLVDVVAGIGDAAASGVMLSMLDDPDPNVSAAAADALGSLGGDSAEQALRRLGASDAVDRLVRISALRSLARLEASVPSSELHSALDDAVLRPAAFSVLAHGNDDEAMECLLKGLVLPARTSRDAAMEALLQMLAREDGERLEARSERIRETLAANADALTRMLDSLGGADLSARLVQIQFLGIVRDVRSVVPILEASRDEALAEVVLETLRSFGPMAEEALDEEWDRLDTELQRAACCVLASGASPIGVSRLLHCLDSPDAELRSVSASALGERGGIDAIDPLVRRLERAAADDDGESEDEVDELVEALVQLASGESDEARECGDRAIAELRGRLDGSPERVRHSIARVLGRIGRPDDAQAVAMLLKDPSAAVRRAAVEGIARLERGTASEPLRLALADEASAVRIAAAVALGRSQGSGVLDDLQRLLGDEDPLVRSAAVRAMAAYCEGAGEGDPGVSAAVVDRLEPALSEPGGVAIAAVEALAQIGGERAARAAAGLLECEDPDVVQAAVACVGAEGGSGTLGELLPLVSHPEWAVRAEAIAWLAERRVAQSVPPILRRLETEQDAFVRDAILRALKRLEA